MLNKKNINTALAILLFETIAYVAYGFCVWKLNWIIEISRWDFYERGTLLFLAFLIGAITSIYRDESIK